VALDLTLDDDLRAEGKARELSRAINELRKTNGFDISDRIAVRYLADGELAKIVERHRDWIMTEVLATTMDPAAGLTPENASALEIAGETMLIELQRA
jgi:isoleucyl-tRNA synthetase